MKDTGYRPAIELKDRMASTEFHEGLGRHKLGEVHDENAYAMGGVAGHAGLFATTKDVAIYGQMWLNGGTYANVQLFSPITVQMAIARYTEGITGANRGLGWVLRGDQWDATGDLFSPLTFGHTGFTGTSLTCDPQHELVVVLLTNRVHFGRQKPIVRLRSIFHNAVAASIQV
jgi:CubicO group peptidase (beta-lactamase class C family)